MRIIIKEYYFVKRKIDGNDRALRAITIGSSELPINILLTLWPIIFFFLFHHIAFVLDEREERIMMACQENESREIIVIIFSFILLFSCKRTMKRKKMIVIFPWIPIIGCCHLPVGPLIKKRNGQQNEDDANDGFSLIA